MDDKQSRRSLKEEGSWRHKRRQKKRAKKARKKARPLAIKIVSGVGKTVGTVLITIPVVGAFGAAVFWNEKGEEISGYITEGYAIAKTIDKAQFEVIDPTVLLDGNGSVIREFKERNYQYISLAEDDVLFQKVSDVVVSIEDERFYEHEGFDYYGVVAAVVNYVRGGDLRGASTITQQLVKNTYLSQEQTMGRKITEAVISQEMENVLTKREILEYYVNDNYYSRGQYGLETAAHYYYSKPVKELSAGELAVLAGIPNNPTIYDPIENPENAREKRDIILGKMRELGKLSQAEYEAEVAKPLNLAVTENPVDNTVIAYEESFAIHNAVEDVMQVEGFTFDYWFDTVAEQQDYITNYNEFYFQTYEDIMRGGYIIETSIDQAKQEELQTVVDNAFEGYWETDAETGLYAKQGAATIVDNRTHEVVAIVGGRTQEGNTFNRAFQSARQPGSTIKPFVAYTPAWEMGYTLNDTYADKAIENGPKNWYPGYWGDVTLRYGLEQSINTIPYRLMKEYGTLAALDKLANMNFSNLHPYDDNPIIAVGGFTLGTNTTEMAGATAALANDGVYHEATNIRKITDTRTDAVIHDQSKVEGKRVYQSGASYLTLMGMQDVVDKTAPSRDWGYKYLAGKTGTTDDNKELWFIGATPYYSAAVYVGYDTPVEQDNIATSNIVGELFREGMRNVHRDLPVIDFDRPATVQKEGTDMWVVADQGTRVQSQRLADEEARKDAEAQAMSARISELDYRIIYGLSKEEEEARERKARAAITVLENFTLEDPEAITEAERLYQNALTVIRDVKRDSAVGTLKEAVNQAMEAKNQEKYALEQHILWEQEQREAERRAERERQLAAEEAARQEEERLAEEAAQQALERRRKEQEEEIEEPEEEEGDAPETEEDHPESDNGQTDESNTAPETQESAAG